MRPFFLGTCRVNGPAALLSKRGFPVRRWRHRAYTPGVALQIVRTLVGEESYTSRNVHLMSTRAFQNFLIGATAATLKELDLYRAAWSRSDMAIIELSTIKECTAGALSVDINSRRRLRLNRTRVERAIMDGQIEAVRAEDKRPTTN